MGDQLSIALRLRFKKGPGIAHLFKLRKLGLGELDRLLLKRVDAGSFLGSGFKRSKSERLHATVLNESRHVLNVDTAPDTI